MNLKRFFREFMTYFSAKAKVERKEKIIAFRTKKYAGFSTEQLNLEIMELERKEDTAKSLSTFLNVATFSGVIAAVVYIFREFSLWIVTKNHVSSQKGISQETLQFGKLVDIGLGVIAIAMLLIFLAWYSDRRNERAIVIHVLKNKLGKDLSHEL